MTVVLTFYPHKLPKWRKQSTSIGLWFVVNGCDENWDPKSTRGGIPAVQDTPADVTTSPLLIFAESPNPYQYIRMR
jgi:hypothetical protein